MERWLKEQLFIGLNDYGMIVEIIHTYNNQWHELVTSEHVLAWLRRVEAQSQARQSEGKLGFWYSNIT